MIKVEITDKELSQAASNGISDFLDLSPCTLLRNGSRTMVCALGYRTHIFHFDRINHSTIPFLLRTLFPANSGKRLTFRTHTPMLFPAEREPGLQAQNIAARPSAQMSLIQIQFTMVPLDCQSPQTFDMTIIVANFACFLICYSK